MRPNTPNNFRRFLPHVAALCGAAAVVAYVLARTLGGR